MEFDVEAPCSASCKRGAVSGKSSISCHPSELQGGAGVVESTIFSGLSKRPASGSVLSVRRLTSSASAVEALESSSPSRKIGSSTPRQKKLAVYFHNRRCSVRAYLDSRLSQRFVLTCSGRQSPLSSEATPSTLSVLSGPRFSVVKPCSCSLVSSNSSSGEVAVVVVFVIICFVAASINSAGPWSDSHKSVTVATSQIHLHHIPRIPGL